MAGLEVEVFGAESLADSPSTAQVRRLCCVAAATGGVQTGHMAIEFVDAERITALNAEYRGKRGATDVLSFPIDGQEGALDGPPHGRDEQLREPPCELGDVLICPEHTVDLCEAIVHGVLHLVGMDHETDAGEMLAVQSEILRWEQIDPQEGRGTRLEGRGTRLEGRGTRLEGRGTRQEGRGTRQEERGTRQEERRTRQEEQGTRLEERRTQQDGRATPQEGLSIRQEHPAGQKPTRAERPV